MRVNDIGDRIGNILRALANRLTAADNFGPEGKKFQVLTSNGPRPTDPPPSYQDIQSVISGALAEAGEDGLPGIQGPAGPAGVDGANGMVPTFIPIGETFTVPQDKQALFAYPIDVEGVMDIQGVLVEVESSGGSGMFGNLDGGEPDTVYGGGFVIDGGGI